MLLRRVGHGALSTISSSHSSRCHPPLPTKTWAHKKPTNVHRHQDVSSAASHGNPGHHISGRCARTTRSAGVICRSRPMWARGPPPDVADAGGGGMGAMMTSQVTACDSLVALSDVFDKWGGDFGPIQAAAALVKYSKLSRRGGGSHRGRSSRLLPLLVNKWLQQLPEAGGRQCANVLWACSALTKYKAIVSTLWDRTWVSYIDLVQRELGGKSGDAINAQHLANTAYAAASLRRQPAADELQLLVQAFLQPEVLEHAVAQGIANFTWALSKLSQAPGWQGGVSEQDLQQLLGDQQLQMVAAGNDMDISNLQFALAGLATGKEPLLGQQFAKACSNQLLLLCATPLKSWRPQCIGNTMWATAELGLPPTAFVTRAVDAAAIWVPNSLSRDLTQAAYACALLQHKDAVFMELLLQRAAHLLQQQPGDGKASTARSNIKVMSAADQASLVALLAVCIVQLDMQQLAGPTRQLVPSSGIRQDASTHPSSLKRLWVFHSWLLQQQLLDGKGLTGLLTEHQLQRGCEEAAQFGAGRFTV